MRAQEVQLERVVRRLARAGRGLALGVYLAMPPGGIGAGGVEEVIEIALDNEAKANLDVSVEAVRELLVACRAIDGSLA